VTRRRRTFTLLYGLLLEGRSPERSAVWWSPSYRFNEFLPLRHPREDKTVQELLAAVASDAT
jgi:hypothetical protein